MVAKHQNLNEQEGVKYYNQNIKEIEGRKVEEEKKIKEWSELEYENYKKKYESSINNYSVFNEKLKVPSRFIFL